MSENKMNWNVGSMAKRRGNNPLQMRVEAISLPKNITPERYIKKLIQVADSGEDLPRDWDVRLHWRNPETRSGRSRFWQEDDFSQAIVDSSAGFYRLLRSMLVNKLRQVRGL